MYVGYNKLSRWTINIMQMCQHDFVRQQSYCQDYIATHLGTSSEQRRPFLLKIGKTRAKFISNAQLLKSICMDNIIAKKKKHTHTHTHMILRGIRSCAEYIYLLQQHPCIQLLQIWKNFSHLVLSIHCNEDKHNCRPCKTEGSILAPTQTKHITNLPKISMDYPHDQPP